MATNAGGRRELIPDGLAEIDLGYLMYEREGPMTLDYEPSFLIPKLETGDGAGPILWTKWFQRHWTDTFIISVIYLVLIFGGQKLMQHRKPFKLDGALVLWNWGLALFSILATVRCLPEAIYQVQTVGFKATVCNSVDDYGHVGHWHLYFTMSKVRRCFSVKVVELGDTFFIVVRKRPLQVLHWYHHVSVLCYTWHSVIEHTAAGRWFVLVNYTVHAFMYTYFALKAQGVRVPRIVAMVVTLLQISQMIVGIYITYTVYGIKTSGKACQHSYHNLLFATLIYASYFCLFFKFFLDAYVFKARRHSVEKSD